jgi:hypothetical protein
MASRDHSSGERAPDDGGPPPPSAERRILAAWREWLAALATDAEAAIAAAHVYAELSPEVREAWLDVLAEDAPRLPVPPIAIYAPLLAVEADAGRRARIEQAIGEQLQAPGRGSALRGVARGGERVVALVTPLYLRFVRVLCCRYLPDEGILWARHDPFVRDDEAPRPGAQIDGVVVEATPMKLVIEELCHAVLAQRRKGAELPAALQLCADLFDAQVEGDLEP